MDRTICEKCDCEKCFMFFGNGNRTGEKYVHIYQDANAYSSFGPVYATEKYNADSTVVKKRGSIECSRAMCEEWTDRFPWDYGSYIPDDPSTCRHYTEHLVSSLNRE